MLGPLGHGAGNADHGPRCAMQYAGGSIAAPANGASALILIDSGDARSLRRTRQNLSWARRCTTESGRGPCGRRIDPGGTFQEPRGGRQGA